MNALVLDAGALVAVDRGDRGDRATIALLAAARLAGLSFVTNANVVAQVWRDDRGRQAVLARFLHSVDVRPVDDAAGRRAGVLLGASGTADVVDATVVDLAVAGDRIVTSDRADLARQLDVDPRAIDIIDC